MENSSRSIIADNASPTIDGCVFENNIYLQVDAEGPYSSPLISNCIFRDNNSGVIYSGDAATPTVVNCLIHDNNIYAGGAIDVVNGDALVVNCTVANNSSSSTGGGIRAYASDNSVVANCIVRGNTPYEINGATVDVTYCNVQGGFAGQGNIDADPLFYDQDHGDYHLGGGSPCIDAGDTEAVPGDADTDVDGNPRFFDDPHTPDTGNGYPCVDIGAYEYQGNIPPVVESLSADPDPAWQGDLVTLTANGVDDADGQVLFVSFYHDLNMNCRLDDDDVELATDSEASDGWEVEIPTDALPVGQVQFMALAYDIYDECGDGACSLVELKSCSSGVEQRDKFTANNADAGDNFGRAVAVNADFIAVSAPGDDNSGTDSGAAYVFDADDRELLHKLKASDAAAGDDFGSSVGIDGSTIVVGASRNDDGGTDSGCAYVFDAVTGEQLHKLKAADDSPGDRLGYSVSICGDTVVAGAYGDYYAGDECGSAYVFDAVTGQQIVKLKADDAAEGNRFGFSVCAGDGIAVIGAYMDDHVGADSGSAYVFDTTTGQQIHKLSPDDAASGDRFGRSVAIHGSIIVVGAHHDDDGGNKSGSAYVFDAATGEQLLKLTADDAVEDAYFGVAAAIDGDRVVIGAFGDSHAGSESGAAYVFDALTGEQLGKLTADDAHSGDRMGQAVSIIGGSALVGAYLDDDDGSGSGSAYLFAIPFDCNDNGVADYCDIRFGTSDDFNDNGIPDDCESECHADVNGDEVVNIDDLFAVLGVWGACDDCPEDVDNSGYVDIDDVFLVLGTWGPCP